MTVVALVICGDNSAHVSVQLRRPNIKLFLVKRLTSYASQRIFTSLYERLIRGLLTAEGLKHEVRG